MLLNDKMKEGADKNNLRCDEDNQVDPPLDYDIAFCNSCQCLKTGQKSTSVCSLLRKQMLKQPVINTFFSRTKLLQLGAIIDVLQSQRTTAV